MKDYRALIRALKKFEGIKTKNPNRHGILRTKTWSFHLLDTHSIDPYQFELSHISGGKKPTGIFKRYLNGEISASLASVNKMGKNIDIENAFLGLFKLPIFELLANKKLGKSQIENILEPYIFSIKGDRVRNIYDRLNFYDYDEISHKFLYSRNLYEFMQLLGWLRMAECKKDSEWHLIILEEIYSIFPWVAIEELFRREYLMLYRCIRDLHNRMYISKRFVSPKVSGIRDSINSCSSFKQIKKNRRLKIFGNPVSGCSYRASL